MCDDAKKNLLELREERGFSLEEVDIEESDALTELYGLMIPVVEINGVEVQYGKINKNVIKNYLNKVIVD